jgi:hypothetical protein
VLQAVEGARWENMSGEEADDFEKAILIVFAQNGLVDPGLKVSGPLKVIWWVSNTKAV